MDFFSRYIEDIYQALNGTLVTVGGLRKASSEEGLRMWCDMTLRVQASHRTLYLVGNGASASMASHMSADFSKNCECRSMTFNDIALMTAVSNDISYDQCFATPLTRFAQEGDLLVTISSSGNSLNILEAIRAARGLGLGVVTLSGMSPDNASRRLGDLNFYIPATTYGLVESCHQALLHCWLDTFLEIKASEVIPLANIHEEARTS